MPWGLLQDHSLGNVSYILYTLTALFTGSNHLYNRPGELVTSNEGIEMQENVWSEIVEELRAKMPEVSRCL